LFVCKQPHYNLDFWSHQTGQKKIIIKEEEEEEGGGKISIPQALPNIVNACHDVYIVNTHKKKKKKKRRRRRRRRRKKERKKLVKLTI
jgi:hypothetical protein